MQKSVTRVLLLLLVFAPALWASKEEKQAQKLDKELKKISLTAAVEDGRRVVNRVMAEQLGISRKQLVEERKQTGFVYGQIFGAHEVARLAGWTFPDVAQNMREGQSLFELSQQRRVNLKEILSDAKKLNKQIEKELDRIASGDEDEQAEDAADSYDPSDDSSAADTAEFTPTEIAQASDQVHHRGGPFGLGGPSGRGQGESGGMGSSRGPGGGMAGGAGGAPPRRGRP